MADEYRLSSDLGTTGLIDMPTARMQPDATFSASYSKQDVTDFYSLSYQATPWLETTFRYSIQDPRVERDLARDDLRDRSYEVKIRLLQEGPFLPEAAVGIRDMGGTGVYASEYFVLSKQIGEFDVTAGLGWGRLAGEGLASNPLTGIDDSFAERSPQQGTGEFRPRDWFAGQDIGVFGGVEYRPKEGPLSLIAEYNSDEYLRETSRGTLNIESPISVGVNWEIAEGLQLSASWQHGSQVGVRISSHLDTASIKPRSLQTFPWSSYHSKQGTFDSEEYTNSWFERMRIDALTSGYTIVSGKIEDGNHALIEYYNRSYTLNTDAAERVMASAGSHLPAEVDRVTLVMNEAGMYPVRITYLRRAMDDRDFQRKNPAAALRQVDFLPGRPIENPDFELDRSSRVLDLDFGLLARYGFFDPDVPLIYQVFAAARADMNLVSGWGISGQYRFDIDNNYNRINRTSDSVLPRVRSDVAQYLKEGESGIDYLYVHKRGQLARGLYYHGYAGILEMMYVGIGGEVLYFPFRSRVAIGANVVSVKQRAFDGGFGTRDYQTTIGHLSAYWATPLYNFDVALHTGRYLAGDWGSTLEINRTFANGWSVGVFATKTDVSAEDFGEGSFDKGFLINIPFNALSVGNSRRGNNVVLRPIQRDGGAKLDGFGTKLWETLRASRYDFLTQTEDRLLHP